MIRLFFLLGLCALAACTEKDTTSHVDDVQSGRSFRYEVFLPEGEGKKPLIVFSHGSGGDFRNYQWLIQTLVSDGYVVAALNHPFNNARDNTDAGVIRVWDRPRDMTLLINAVLENPAWREHINPDQIVAVGHSSGGYTALALAGAVYHPDLMRAYCTGKDRGPDCDLANKDTPIDYADASLSYRDDRIKAVIAMAPAVGPAIDDHSLRSITVPVLILATEDDEVLPIRQHAQHYANVIEHSELKLLSGGGHFIYMQCNIATKIADLFIRNLDLCGHQFEVDRGAVRREIASDILGFLSANVHP